MKGAAIIFVGAVLTMGNVMLLTAPALFIVGAILCVDRYFPPSQPLDTSDNASFKSGFAGAVKRLIIVLAMVSTAFVVKFGIMSLLGMQDDAHIMNILKFKLSGFSTTFEDFQTLLYVCSGAYQIMKWKDLEFLQSNEALPGRFATIVVVVLLLALVDLRKSRPHLKAIDAALLFATANGILLAGLLCLIQRLSSVGVPFLCILVSQISSPTHVASIANLFSSRARSAEDAKPADRQVTKKKSSDNASSSSSGHSKGTSKWLKFCMVGLGLAIAAAGCQQAYIAYEESFATIESKSRPATAPKISRDMIVRCVSTWKLFLNRR